MKNKYDILIDIRRTVAQGTLSNSADLQQTYASGCPVNHL